MIALRTQRRATCVTGREKAVLKLPLLGSNQKCLPAKHRRPEAWKVMPGLVRGMAGPMPMHIFSGNLARIVIWLVIVASTRVA